MKKQMRQLLVLLVITAMLLTGCGLTGLGGYLGQIAGILGGYVPYSAMEYYRPDMVKLEQALQDACDAAMDSEDLNAVLDGIYAYYALYDEFYTGMSLAYIRYCGDLTDIYWEQEYDYCSRQQAQVSAGLDKLYRTLAKSPLRQELESDEYFGADFFDAYEGESFWDEEYTALLEQEAALENEYYELYTGAMEASGDSLDGFYREYTDDLTAILVKLVAHRQKIAAYMGYDSYGEYAYDFVHYRDYTPVQAENYIEEICRELVPLYRQVCQSMLPELNAGRCTEEQMFRYVRDCAERMGGQVEDAFDLLESAGLYDIQYRQNKYDVSFEVFLESYLEPFVFVNPLGSDYDKLTFAHEFGHFAHDYVCGGSYAGVDVAEVASQGMEYLSLCYGADTADLEKLKMADSLCIFVEQAAYASFEHQLYALEGDALTADNVARLYEQVCVAYGFESWDWDSRSYVLVNHFFTEPMYIISYVVSNDAALQLYQMEKEEAGTGLALYEKILTSEDAYFCCFTESVGLDSPFDAGRVKAVRETLENVLNSN